jgi:hypothetical protein
LEDEMTRKPREQKLQKVKDEQDRELSRELEMTFPASDPPASTEPGGGVTGPEAAPRRPAKAKGRPT